MCFYWAITGQLAVSILVFLVIAQLLAVTGSHDAKHVFHSQFCNGVETVNEEDLDISGVHWNFFASPGL